ncbi:hypothetical protein T265_04840 [Opisthorchis viverrini]|uniref:M protein repeat protein n=1 Tax=Opisthorchis viverrini TaxID=6198 RepID=A0A074ZMJ0_OPIVI|nr:hypothetical protein T265_04840 [Opisthorchis viverrini]KER28311.1 hypothetical protein T265_04840 [Opisthorchis viverrini]
MSSSSTGGLFRRSSLPTTNPATSDSQESTPGTPVPSGGQKSKKECFVFEPQQWRRTVCKNCFRTQPEHRLSTGKDDGPGGPNVVLRRTDSIPSQSSNPTATQHAQSDVGADSTSRHSEHKTATGRDNGRNGTASSGNAARATARKLASGQRVGDEHRSQTSTIGESRRTGTNSSGTSASTATGIYSSASSIDARYIEELENDFFALEDKHDALLRERELLASELETKVRMVADLQSTLEQYREKVTLLERRCIHMEEEIKSYRERLRLPESDQSPPSHDRLPTDGQGDGTSNGAGMGDLACSGELQQRLNEVEQLCQEVMEENEQLKEEVEEMQREIEEMHDHFQEDDRDAMRELQRDLEAANKTCRILQFKLRKAERRFEQCESERANLEERLARLEAELYSEADVAHIRNLEEEIRVAKEVGVRLNNELDILDEKRAFYEQENHQLKEELQACHNRRIAVENELGRLKLEAEKLKAEQGILDKGPLQVTDRSRSRQTNSRPSLSREASFEEQQLQRELDASRERETDLSEQLRFAEEEVRKMKRRVKESQVENELLSKKLERLYTTQPKDPFQFGQTVRSASAGAQPRTPSESSQTPDNTAGDGSVGNGMKSSPGQMETELTATRRQLNLVEEENLGLRRKILAYERDLTAAQGRLQRTGPSRITGSPQLDSQELDSLRNQLNLIQDHLARMEHERDRLESENQRLRCTEGDSRRSTVDSSAGMEALVRENEAIKSKLKEGDRRLRHLAREVALIGSIERDHEWIEKYNDARETIKEQEIQLSRSKKRVAELQDENARLRADERKVEQRSRRAQEKGSSTPHMSREALAHEIKSLEEELDEVTADLTAAREQACTAQLRVTYLEDNNNELRAEAERRERELVSYIFHLENKNQVLTNLLNILQDRSDGLQNELDRLLNPRPPEEFMEASQASGISTASMGSDDVFGEQTEGNKNDIERQLRSRILCLERMLKEEKCRSESAETQLQKAVKESTAQASISESQLKSKQLELLKKELDEKDELLEAKEEQVADLKSRIDQSRKMNDALRALMEKEPDSEKQSTIQNTEAQVEIVSYRKEIESARKEMQILRNNLAQAEKIRERLLNDNRELQEELKLREDSIFDQDDELEKRHAEIRALKTAMETLQKELEQTKRDLTSAKTRDTPGSSGRLSAQIAQNEKIRAELHETTRELNELKLKFDEFKRASELNEERLSQLSTDHSQMRNALQEKDSIIIELNRALQKSAEEVSQCKMFGQTSQMEKVTLERQLTEVKNALHTKEQELAALQTKLTEATDSVRSTTAERLGSSQESGIGGESPSSRDGTLSRRSAEVDRLRRELSMMRRERDDLVAEVKRLRTKLEKRHAVEMSGTKDTNVSGLVGLPSGNAYVKAIAAQQSTTKITLLNEHITSLNRTIVELKLQNESLQNQVIDYQRRYRSVKEQYEGEQEAWLTERVVLESKAKEQEDRKLTIASTRKLLQEMTTKLFELETSSEKKYQELQGAYEKLENEKASLELKLAQFEDQQKLPKVLQRFSTNTTASRPGGVLAAQSRNSVGENKDVTRRMESAEKMVAKLRAEIVKLQGAREQEQCAALKDAESARLAVEQELEDLRDRMVTMECYRQQAELFRHRHFEVEERAEREFKIWQEEREHLLYRAEEARANIEQWCLQLQYRVDSDTEKAEDVVNEVLKQMDKWRSSKGKVPCLKRRDSNEFEGMIESLYSFDGAGASLGLGSVPSSPATGILRTGPGLGSSNISSFTGIRGQAQRSTSMEWGNGRSALASGVVLPGPQATQYRESSLGVGGHVGSGYYGGNLRGSAMSLAMGTGVGGGSNYSLMMANRCGRSVSPEVSVRKVSNYPDPTPGFLVRPTSRQGSNDSLSSVGDYTQRSFTLPGKPPVRSIISPARKKFFEDTSSVPVTISSRMSQPPDEIPSSEDRQLTSEKSHMEPLTKTPDDLCTSEKLSSKPPPAVKSGTPEKTKSSLADRFVKWSSYGSKSGSKTSLNELGKESGTSKKHSKKSEEERKKVAASPERAAHKLSSCEKSFAEDTESGGKYIRSKVCSVPPTSESSSNSGIGGSTSATTQASTSKPIKRSGSVSTISPAIMALRQKFSGGSKS